MGYDCTRPQRPQWHRSEAIDFWLPLSAGAFLATVAAEAGSTASLCVVVLSGLSLVACLVVAMLRNIEWEKQDRICDEWERENGFRLGPRAYTPDEDDGGKAG